MPADPHDMPALIAALEAATVGSQALDYEIARLVGWEPTACDMACGDDEPPAFSVNLHAALMLVPDDADWLVRKAGDVLDGKPMHGLVGRHGAWAATPALAMCCAALRARSAG